jgi:adenylyltransferase/sulfurtransferase
MDDSQLSHYQAHILLPDIDVAGQQHLANARALIIGLGGLGSPVAYYLAASGVGHLVLVDFDNVELSNLQRQILHDHARLGINKAVSAQQRLQQFNPETQISTLTVALQGDDLVQQVALADVVIDCTDNFASRFALNQSCVAQRKPLVSGAAIRYEGQLSTFDFRRIDSPCYRCLYPEGDELPALCSQNGVLSPLVGVIGSLQAVEALKLLLNLGEPLVGRLLLFDAKQMRWRTLNLPKDPHCPVCRRLVS